MAVEEMMIGQTEEKKGNLLKDQRIALGLTQQKVANRAKCSLQQYQKFEMGERNLRNASFQLACRILEALEMDIVKYYHDEEKP